MTKAQTIFRAGEGGYHTYRIPALLTLPAGRVLAFCEGRLNDWEDYGKIDMVLRTSDDGGRTFSPLRVIAQMGKDTIDNPCPVFDPDTGRIWLFLNTNLAEGSEREINKNLAPRGVGAIHSDDMGDTWSDFEDMTESLKKPGWTWYATGPCHALRLPTGRMVIPCNHGVFDPALGDTDTYMPHVILSDDHGKTWRLGGTVEGVCGNETAVEVLSDGTIYLNSRSMHGRPYRLTARSLDGGETWTDAREDEHLPDPMCQAAVLAYPAPYGGCARPLMFSNNPYEPAPGGANRRDLTVRLSLDEGKTWPRSLRLFAGHTAYGDLTVLSDGRVACLFECGENHPYERIDLTIFTLDEIKTCTEE